MKDKRIEQYQKEQERQDRIKQSQKILELLKSEKIEDEPKHK